MKDIDLRKTLEDYCDARELALSDYRGLLATAERLERNLSRVGPYLAPAFARDLLTLEAFTQALDRRLWSHAYQQTGLAHFFDHTAKKAFEDSLERNPPAFTLDNARSALLSSAAEADTMFARGVVELFLDLSHIYATNREQPFEIGRKFILDYMVEPGFGGGLRLGYGRGRDQINDLDRVVKILDGEPFQPFALASAVNAAFGKGETFEDAYYRIRGFKKGTLHIELKREDLRLRINQTISDYYQGRALATAA